MVNSESLVPFQCIAEAYAPHLEQLTRSLRYWAYQGDMSDRDFVGLMGPDVVFLTHPDETARIARDFIIYSRQKGVAVSQEDESLLLIACWIHDLGELIIDGDGVGDIRSHLKTKKNQEQEREIFIKVMEPIADGGAKQLVLRAYDEVVMGNNLRLGRMFSAIERSGYLETTMRAFLGVEGERIPDWLGLCGVTLSHHIKPWLEFAADYPYMEKVLQESRTGIGKMFKEVLKVEDVPLDNEGKPFYEKSQVEDARRLWVETIGKAA